MANGEAPTSVEELVGWYESGRITQVEFFPYLLFLARRGRVDQLMSCVPQHLHARIIRDARSLMEARDSGEELLDFTFGAAKASAECEEALFQWIRDTGRCK